jgi:hypothetical protein
MDRELLERPFEAHLIKSRRGVGGKRLSSVEGAEYIKRLNEAFAGRWTFEVLDHRVLDAEVVVLGRLEAGGVKKVAFGGSSITTSGSTGGPVSLADDLKAAATDSLKKASSLLGIGLHLYGDATEEQHGHRGNGAASAGHGGSSGNGGRWGGNGHGARAQDRLTERQLSAIWGMGRALGVSSAELRRRTTEVFGVEPEGLTKGDASSFIGELKEALDGGNGAMGGAA